MAELTSDNFVNSVSNKDISGVVHITNQLSAFGQSVFDRLQHEQIKVDKNIVEVMNGY
jgi:hypothetical protein